jgi:hypothetical protein
MLTVTTSREHPSSFVTDDCEAVGGEDNFIWPPAFTLDSFTEPYTEFFQEITPNDEGSKHSWKSFENYKLSSDIPTMSYSIVPHGRDFGYLYSYLSKHSDPFYGVPSNSYFGSLGRFNSNLPSMYSKRPDGGFVPAPDDLDALRQRALSSMMPRLKAELSLINSSIELKDFVSLPHSLKTIYETFAKVGIVRTAKNAFKTFKQVVKELTHTSADSYLQLKFNLQPLLSDIEGVFSSIHKLERRINDIVAREGSVQTRHFAFAWNEFPDVPTDSRVVNTAAVSDFWSQNGVHYNYSTTAERQVFNSSSWFHVEMKFNYNFTSYQREHARILGLLDSLGVNLNPQIIWNAIPWSFVVDWVIGVGQWLGQFQRLNLEPQINIIDFLWTVKRHRAIHMHTKVGNAWPGIGFSEPVKKLVCVTNETSYRRSVGLPPAGSILLSGLSSTEFSLGAALILSQRRRHK